MQNNVSKPKIIQKYDEKKHTKKQNKKTETIQPNRRLPFLL